MEDNRTTSCTSHFIEALSLKKEAHDISLREGRSKCGTDISCKFELLRKCIPHITIPEFWHAFSLLCNYLENLRFNNKAEPYIRFFFSFCPRYHLLWRIFNKSCTNYASRKQCSVHLNPWLSNLPVQNSKIINRATLVTQIVTVSTRHPT
jgi:hypothetical protein